MTFQPIISNNNRSNFYIHTSLPPLNYGLVPLHTDAIIIETSALRNDTKSLVPEQKRFIKSDKINYTSLLNIMPTINILERTLCPHTSSQKGKYFSLIYYCASYLSPKTTRLLAPRSLKICYPITHQFIPGLLKLCCQTSSLPQILHN